MTLEKGLFPSHILHLHLIHSQLVLSSCGGLMIFAMSLPLLPWKSEVLPILLNLLFASIEHDRPKLCTFQGHVLKDLKLLLSPFWDAPLRIQLPWCENLKPHVGDLRGALIRQPYLNPQTTVSPTWQPCDWGHFGFASCPGAPANTVRSTEELSWLSSAQIAEWWTN